MKSRDLVAEYQQHKKRLEDLNREESKLQGALEQLFLTLENECQCDTLDKAEKLLKEKRKELKELEEQLTQSLTEYETKWSSILENDS